VGENFSKRGGKKKFLKEGTIFWETPYIGANEPPGVGKNTL